MWNSAYTQKRIFYAYIKTLQIKLLVSSAAKEVSHIKYNTLRKWSFSLPVNVQYHSQTIKFPVGTVVESLYT